MDNFIVSARKYRPATFDMVVGQESITNTLKNAIRNHHLAQAYLFCGPRGVGKTTCARILAKTINCINLKESIEACDECESCISFNTLRSFNIHELDAASNNKVEDIRSLNEQVRIPPQIGKYSIYIIDEVHMLTSSAFNAFLKTLEEPPPHAIFILATTEKHKIIPTILSRCQIFDFNRIKVDDIVKRLLYVANNESVAVEEEALHVIARKADGALRDALSIFDQVVSLAGHEVTYRHVIENLNVLDYEYYFRCVDAALKGDISSILLIFNEILENGFDGLNFISGLSSHLRDLLVCMDEATVKLLETAPSVRQRYLDQARQCSAVFLYKALDIGSNCDITYRNSKNPRLHVELALLKMCLVNSSSAEVPEKKNPENGLVAQPEVPVVSDSKPLLKRTQPQETETSVPKEVKSDGVSPGTPERSISIKKLIADSTVTQKKPAEEIQPSADSPLDSRAEELNADTFLSAWSDFISNVENEGPRIVSMFKTIKPELEDDLSVKIHLSNAAQKDLFILEYRPRLTGFLEKRFNIRSIDIETTVDVSEKNDLPYSDDQKLTYLQTKYPAIKDFRKTFNLDIT